MQLPRQLLDSLVAVKGFDRTEFEKVHASGEQVTSVRLNPKKIFSKGVLTDNTQYSMFNVHGEISWTEHGYYLANRPSFTFDPLFHAGCYYVQEASSMFLEQALKQTVDLTKPLRVLDLCAAPGGKSTHILSLISKDSLLVSNEIIKSRANILMDNIDKWGCSNVMVTNNDPKDFQQLENYFDVIVVDAPCSGSGLFRRDPEAISEWSLNNVNLCSQRQQRILADVLPALKNGGVLIYSTCSYSNEEDEEIVEWMKTGLKINNEELIIDPGWGVVESSGGYRFWPDKIKGEGFFIACFRNGAGEDEEYHHLRKNTDKFSKIEMEILNSYVKTEGLSFLQHGKIIHAVPENLNADIDYLQSKLRTVNFGSKIGEIIRGKMVPDHALAISNIISGEVETVELSYEQAIQYLKKKEVQVEIEKKGWKVVTYHGHPLGWINVLPNRINNYYPKELRILKD